MTNRRQLLLAVSTVALGLAGAGSARADAIDGTWCAEDGRSFSIQGPQIVTPGGTATRGDYSRHAFAYVVPSSEDGAGARILMDLLDENTVRLMNGADSEIWRRCDLSA